MPRTATKAASNIFYKARMEAARHNEKLNSREGAAELIGIDRTRLAQIELETVIPYPEEVLLIADLYNTPELLNYYCSRCCPIGKRTVMRASLQEIDRVTINLLAAVGGLDGIDKAMLNIAEDGMLSSNEIPVLKKIIGALGKIEKATAELKILVAKTEGGI